jgi:signal transduction histidine kinase
MMIIDLQWLIFGLLVLMLFGIGVVIWFTDGRSDQEEPALVQVLGRAPFGVLILAGNSVRYINAEAQHLLKLSSDASSLPDTDWAELLQQDLAHVRQGDDDSGRYRNVTFVSGRTARWWVSSFGDRDVVILLDISAQHQARRAGRTLLSDLGHELRTPVATLLTHLEILGLQDVGEEVQRQSLQLSRREAQRMSRLINDMLELGRLEMSETLTRRPIKLLTLVEDVAVQSAPRAAQRSMTIEVEASSALPLVPADADRLRQAYLNLVDNALKYGDAGARVTLSLRRVDDRVLCAVCDTGPGIPAEHLPFVKRRFYRAAADDVEGSGLGLALVEEIVRRHGGELEIVSPVQEGRGVCVRFALPLSWDTEQSGRQGGRIESVASRVDNSGTQG